jgi:hypothetical protein
MRLFTFGCSYTRWHWPTWADIIARDIGCHYENWAEPGLGNVGIQHKMLECDLKNKFTADDLVLVAWSGWTREDRYLGASYSMKFLEKYWHLENDIMKNATAIITANQCHNINYQSHIFDYDVSLNERTGPSDQRKSPVDSKFDYLIDALPNKILFDNTNNTQYNGLVPYDRHPDILCQLEYVNTVYDTIGRKLKDETVNYYTNMYDNMISTLTQMPTLSKHSKVLAAMEQIFGKRYMSESKGI